MLPKHCRNGHGKAFQSKTENRYPWDAPAGQAGKRRDSSEHSGAEQLLRARHTGWVILSRERTGAGSKESHLE